LSVAALPLLVDGSASLPVVEADWQDWISATEVRNYCLKDPLLDWLDLYGDDSKFPRDTHLKLYDERTDMARFIQQQGHRFEQAVVSHLQTLAVVQRVGLNAGDARSFALAHETFSLMRDGVEIIHQGVLWDAEARTYGMPDLLVRSDVLARLFPGLLSVEQAAIAAPNLGGRWHYRVIDIKFTTLSLLKGGTLANSGSFPAYQAQLAIYNHALARLQGYAAPVAYLLGRGWSQRIDGKEERGDHCLERLGPVDTFDPELIAQVNAACAWLRDLRTNGMNWAVLPEPSINALRPNVGHTEDSPWRQAKREIARLQEELTLLWQVGADKRNGAIAAGVTRWRDAACCPASVGVNGAKQGPILQAILDINRSEDGHPVRPPYISAARDLWHSVPELEFYVDFETVTDMNDDFLNIPMKGGQPLIFMIGCGYVEAGAWRYRCFITDSLTERDEAVIIDEWIAHMEAVRKRLAPGITAPRVIHWSPAEVSFLETAYNAAAQRHPERQWSSPHWFDFLKNVIKEEPVVVRGAMGFGLKAIAKALHQHALIGTRWADGPVDGLGAMVGAWWCAQEAAELGRAMHELDLMHEIEEYNEVDCKVMMEIVQYLRRHH
jgi:predicted RecB family nuclease